MDLDAAAALRTDDLARSPWYPGGDIPRTLQKAQRFGELRTLEDARGARAVFAAWLDPAPLGGLMTTHLIAHRRREDPEALAWLQAQLSAALPEAQGVRSCMLAVDELDLRRHLMAEGLRIQHVSLVGRVDEALSRLLTLRGPEDEGLPEGLQERPLTPDDAGAFVALRERVFAEDPRFCWFGTLPGYLAEEEMRLAAGELGPGHRRLLLHEGRVVGYHGSSYHRPDPHSMPSSGGIDLMLEPAWRGRGLSWLLYRRLLRAMAEARIGWIKGSTARLPVLRVGRALGRGLTAVTLRSDAPFDEAWFGEHLPG